MVPLDALPPPRYQHLEIKAGARHSLQSTCSEQAVDAACGRIEVDGEPLKPVQMAVLSPGKPLTICAQTASVVMLLGGEPVGERHIFWNLVSSCAGRLRAASDDRQTGRMKLPDAFAITPELSTSPLMYCG